jgi:hypothetical protein
LNGLRDFTLDGNGSTFVLDPRFRLLHLTGCTHATVRGFSLDFDPLPFADGIVISKDPAKRSIDVKVHDGFALPPLGGPTHEREQAYFAMLWHQGPYSLLGKHYFVEDTREAYAGSLKDRVIRVIATRDFHDFGGIVEGRTRISLPVRGVAHKVQGHGASPAIVIEENESVCCEDMNIWSAPLFAVNVARNRGVCVFRRFNICPKPGTTRLTSCWRDGFHVKGNYARLLWEDCRLEGMNDDSLNIATHSSRIVEVLRPKTVRIRQNFPLGFICWFYGDNIEGPLPRDVVIKNCRLRVGRGNHELVASFTSLIAGTDGKQVLPRQPVINNVLLQNSTVDGIFDIGFAENVTLSANRFLPPRGRLRIHDSRSILLEDNRLGGLPLNRLDQIVVPDEFTRRTITIR